MGEGGRRRVGRSTSLPEKSQGPSLRRLSKTLLPPFLTSLTALSSLIQYDCYSGSNSPANSSRSLTPLCLCVVSLA